MEESNGKVPNGVAPKNGDVDHDESDDEKEDGDGALEAGANGGSLHSYFLLRLYF